MLESSNNSNDENNNSDGQSQNSNLNINVTYCILQAAQETIVEVTKRIQVLASTTEEEGILIERPDFVSCRLPKWRVRLNPPEDETKGPRIPKDAKWKYI